MTRKYHSKSEQQHVFMNTPLAPEERRRIRDEALEEAAIAAEKWELPAHGRNVVDDRQSVTAEQIAQDIRALKSTARKGEKV